MIKHHTIVVTQAILDIVECSLAAVSRITEDFRVVRMHHVQRNQYKILPMRAFGGHRFQLRAVQVVIRDDFAIFLFIFCVQHEFGTAASPWGPVYL